MPSGHVRSVLCSFVFLARVAANNVGNATNRYNVKTVAALNSHARHRVRTPPSVPPSVPPPHRADNNRSPFYLFFFSLPRYRRILFAPQRPSRRRPTNRGARTIYNIPINTTRNNNIKRVLNGRLVRARTTANQRVIIIVVAVVVETDVQRVVARV